MRTDVRAADTPGSTQRAIVVRGPAPDAARLAETLVGEGFRTVLECAGAEAISVVERAGAFDLVVVDGDADGIAALDLVAFLRHRLVKTPILFMGPAEAALLARAARERGATGCVSRPVDPDAAAAVVRAVMRGGSDGAAAGREQARGPAAPIEGGRGGGRLWGIVLAGGEGRRLRTLVRHIHGDARPKQYARLVGTRSLLERTLDRVSLLLAPERTVLVTVQQHRRYLDEAVAARAVDVLAQPCDGGTAAGIMLPVQWIARRDPQATVAIFPSDHFVGQERRFMAHVADAAAFVQAQPARIVLVGAEASGPETEYGWIEPAEPLSRIGATEISGVARFVEKPSPAAARACLEAGALWNTFVVIARAATLVDVARQVLPVVHDELAGVVGLLGTSFGVTALRRTYPRLPATSFSTAVLERCAPLLAVSRLRGVAWCDWGSPYRVIRTLRQLGEQPDWLDTLAASRLT